ncbi:hypothetical protein MPDQ_003252 [Monascus purpureus]|uniref:Cyanovirin-N domain-containing protein n=1 Tax=Monascus purpureus TaxID=5098 RepID=A0A507QJ29_MONPU|nr:hypothetical protein MPDQ_003252 [Monascus purpureus]
MAAQGYYGAPLKSEEGNPPREWSTSPALHTPSSSIFEGSYPPPSGYGHPPQPVPPSGNHYAPHPNYNDFNTAQQAPPYAQQGPYGLNQPRPHSPYSPNDAHGYAQPNYQYSGQQQYHRPPPPSPCPPTDPAAAGQGEKGVLGAVAGGAAGGFAGHKVNHGFLGAVGGAIAGSLAENTIRKHRKKEEEKGKRWGVPGRRNSSSSSSSSSDGERSACHGNFSSSSTGIRLEHGHILAAHCTSISGHARQSSIDLNDVLENVWGKFSWKRGGNFFQSARNVRLRKGGRVLEAELGNGQGGSNRARVRLDERISNQDGFLVYLA